MNYYRYQEILWAPPADEFGHATGGGSITVEEQEFPVLKKTPKGVWLDLGMGMKRFVLDSAKKRFACPTKCEAAESFKKRKERQISILTRQIQVAKIAMSLVHLPEQDRRYVLWS